MSDIVKFGIQLPEWYERELRLWAKLKGTTRANLAANVVQNRIEENREKNERQIEAIARYRGISVDDLIKEWLNGGAEDEPT